MNKFIFTLLIIALIITLSVLFLDRIVTFSVNHLTDYEISYEKWKNILSGTSEIDALHVASKGNKLGISAEKVFFNVRFKESLKEKKLIVDCTLQGARFTDESGSEEAAAPEEDILAMPFSPDHRYDKITLTAYLDTNVLEVSDFKATSKDILMEGDCVFIKNTDNISLDWKISFSPQLSGSLPEDLRSAVLSHDGEGWYSTVISYKGNVFMLKALYSLTA